MAANLGAHLDPRENGADNARIISAMDPPHDRRRAPPLPPRTTPFSGRTRRVSALLHSSEIVTERLRPLRRQGKPTFRSDPPCKQKQTTPEDFQQLPMTIKYLPQQHEIRAIEMKHTPEGHYIKTTAATIEVIRAQDEAHKKGWIKEALRRYELYISTYSSAHWTALEKHLFLFETIWPSCHHFIPTTREEIDSLHIHPWSHEPVHKRSTRQLQLREQKLRELQLQEKLLDPSQHTRNTAASIALHAAIAATHAGCIAEHTAGWRRFLWNENYPPVPNKYFETYIRTKAADDTLLNYPTSRWTSSRLKMC